ncbi:hypothetical protein [Enterobacter roggenkampii]|nr:hypothetical protein [Enterobacter roggenkampii]
MIDLKIDAIPAHPAKRLEVKNVSDGIASVVLIPHFSPDVV